MEVEAAPVAIVHVKGLNPVPKGQYKNSPHVYGDLYMDPLFMPYCHTVSV